MPTFQVRFPGVDASNWHGLVAPARTVPGPLAALRRAAIAAAGRGGAEALHDQGAIPGGDSPEEFGAFIASENRKWAEVIRRNNIQPE